MRVFFEYQNLTLLFSLTLPSHHPCILSTTSSSRCTTWGIVNHMQAMSTVWNCRTPLLIHAECPARNTGLRSTISLLAENVVIFFESTILRQRNSKLLCRTVPNKQAPLLLAESFYQNAPIKAQADATQPQSCPYQPAVVCLDIPGHTVSPTAPAT